MYVFGIKQSSSSLKIPGMYQIDFFIFQIQRRFSYFHFFRKKDKTLSNLPNCSRYLKLTSRKYPVFIILLIIVSVNSDTFLTHLKPASGKFCDIFHPYMFLHLNIKEMRNLSFLFCISFL